MTLLVAALTLLAPVSVKDLSGKNVTIPDPASKATVVFFIGTDCPISNRLAPSMSRISSDFSGKGIKTIFVYADKATVPAEARAHLAKFKLGGTAVIDSKHLLVKLSSATVTPEACIFMPDGTVAYHGRINDLYSEHNRTRTAAKTEDVRLALGEILAGKPVTTPFQTPVGCSIVLDD